LWNVLERISFLLWFTKIQVHIILILSEWDQRKLLRCLSRIWNKRGIYFDWAFTTTRHLDITLSNYLNGLVCVFDPIELNKYSWEILVFKFVFHLIQSILCKWYLLLIHSRNHISRIKFDATLETIRINCHLSVWFNYLRETFDVEVLNLHLQILALLGWICRPFILCESNAVPRLVIEVSVYELLHCYSLATIVFIITSFLKLQCITVKI
jgi:hypothetical protein